MYILINDIEVYTVEIITINLRMPCMEVATMSDVTYALSIKNKILLFFSYKGM